MKLTQARNLEIQLSDSFIVVCCAEFIQLDVRVDPCTLDTV